jgi:hypothetical protein
MAFAAVKLKFESGASRIQSYDAYSFVAHMRAFLSKQVALAVS